MQDLLVSKHGKSGVILKCCTASTTPWRVRLKRERRATRNVGACGVRVHVLGSRSIPKEHVQLRRKEQHLLLATKLHEEIVVPVVVQRGAHALVWRVEPQVGSLERIAG